MRKLRWILAALALGMFACAGPKGYVIRGEVTGFPDSTIIYLWNLNTETLLDSVPILGGRFRLEGVVEQEPELMRLSTHGREWTNLLIGNETVEVRGAAADFPFRVAKSGSKYQDQQNIFDGLTREYSIRRDSLVKCYYALSDEQRAGDEMTQLGLQMRAIDRITDSIQTEYIFAHPDTYPSLIQLGFKMYSLPKDTVRSLFDRMSPELQASRYGKPVSIFLASTILSVGDPFFDFEAEDQNGKSLRFSDLVGRDGKYVLLEFMDTGCGYCKLAAREMSRVMDDFSDSVRMVSFSMDAKREDWQKLLVRDSITWTSLWSEKGGLKGEICIPYRIRGRPAFIVIDPQGKIVQKWEGYGPGMFEERIGRLKNK